MNYSDFEKIIKEIKPEENQVLLRLLCIESVKRATHFLPVESLQALQKSEEFALGKVSKEELAVKNNLAEEEAIKATPVDGVPNQKSYATSAAVDASSIWERNHSNVLATCSCVASALATEKGESQPESFDEVFDDTFSKELDFQVKILERLKRERT